MEADNAVLAGQRQGGIADTTWLVVANPVSGGGKGVRDRSAIEAALRSACVDFKFIISEYHGHAIELVAEAVRQGCRRVLAVGGDGTVNECVNGIFRQQAVAPDQVLLAVLPIGTGNDWARTHFLCGDYGVVARSLNATTPRRHDVGRVHFADGSSRYFANVAGIGFDAHVVAAMPEQKPGPIAYLLALLRGLIKFRAVAVTLVLPAERIEERAFVLFFAIGRYCGGGMNVAPQAATDDGLFDITLVAELSRWEVLRNLRRLFDGSLLTHPKVTSRRAAGGEVLAEAAQPIEADGELIGHAPARIEMLAGALCVLVAD